MRSFLLGAVAAIGLCPTVASAVVRLNVERVDVVPTGAEQTVFIEVFAEDLEPAENEQLSGFTIALVAPTFAQNGVRFGLNEGDPIPLPVAHPYVFGAFPGVLPENAFVDPQNVFVAGATPGTQNSNISDTLNGFFRVPVIIPGNAAPGLYTVLVDPPPNTALAGQAGPITTVIGPAGGVNVVPEPASLGLIVLGGLLTLRRRRVA